MTDMDSLIMERMREHLASALETVSNDWFVIVAQGSMNYGIFDSESDVDTKLLVLPTLKELVLNKRAVNKVHIMENDEHCDLKDVRDYFKIFRKSNINFVEILFSDYYIVNERYHDLWLTLRANAEELARMNPYAAISCMKGMALEKMHALCHEYPSRMPWIEKYGYDPKQLSHLARIAIFLTKYIEGYNYRDCIYFPEEEYRNALLQCKRNGQNRTKEEAIEWANILKDFITLYADKAREHLKNENDPEMDALLNNILYELVTRSLKFELEK